MIKYYRQSVKDSVVADLDSFEAGSWVYAENPNSEEIAYLVERFNLEEGHIQDALDPYEVPRLEEDGDSVYIYTRTPVLSGTLYTTSPVLIIIHPKTLITVSRSTLPVFEPFISGTKIFHTTNRIKLFIRFFNEIILHYSTAITKINKLAATATVNIDNIRNRDIVALVVQEQILNEYLNAVVQTNAYLRTLMTHRTLLLNETERDLVEDLFLATGQLIALYKSSLQQVKNIRDAYSTIMTNNLNRIIKFFTALTIVMTVPMIVASFFGMNVRLPLGEHPMAFGLIFASTLVFSALILFVFQKRRWL